MKNKMVRSGMVLLLSAAMLMGCGSSAATGTADSAATTETAADADSAATAATGSSADTASTSASAEAGALPTQDLAGNEITVPEEVDAIVTMSPSSTRLVIDLGLADKIVACDTYSYEYYGESLTADIPQFDMMTPDQEALVALTPDIIFTTGMSYAGGTDVYASVRDSGICLADIPSAASLDDIEKSIDFIGSCVGASDEASAIVTDMQDTIDEIAKIAETIPEEDKKSVLYESSTPSSDSPAIYSAGTGTYIDEIITAIGAENPVGDQEGWISVTEEDAVAANPDVIITTDTYTPDVVKTLLSLEGWENVTAVANKDVYLMTYSNELSQPNQHVISAMVEMAKDVYPDAYADLEDPFADTEDAAA